MSDLLKTQGVNSLGYGIVPKKVMMDRELTAEAKAIYAYFCSFAGSGEVAFPSVKKTCYDLKIGEERYYKHRKLLLDVVTPKS